MPLVAMSVVCLRVIVVKLDFASAFNSLRRDNMREAIHAPGLLAYVDSAYGSTTTLRFGKFTVDSAEGVQQGDPLGPLLFYLTIYPLLQGIKAEFVSDYLDDIGVGGPVNVVAADIRQLENKACQFGLRLNYHKCEVIGLNLINTMSWDWETRFSGSTN